MSLLDHTFLSEDRNYDEFVEFNQIPLLDTKDLCAVADEVMNDNGYLNMQQNNDLYYEFCANIGVNDKATLTFEAICSPTGIDMVFPWEKIECYVDFTQEELYAKVNELLKAESTSIAALFNREEEARKEDLFSDGKSCFDVEGEIEKRLTDFTTDLFVEYQDKLAIATGDSPDTVDDEITNLSIAMTQVLLWQDKYNEKKHKYKVLVRDFYEAEVEVDAATEEDAINIAYERDMKMLLSSVDDKYYISAVDGVERDVPERR